MPTVVPWRKYSAAFTRSAGTAWPMALTTPSSGFSGVVGTLATSDSPETSS